MTSSFLKENKITEEDPLDIDFEDLDPFRIPSHVAIMMDGNRRWAKERGLSPILGHLQGVEALVQTVKASLEFGIKTLTVYAFSTENWMRSSSEVSYLIELFKSSIMKYKGLMIEEGVCLDIIGDISRFPTEVREVLREAVHSTQGGENLGLVIALNYGARDELRRAIQAIVKDCHKGKFQVEQINEKLISGYLDTAKWGDPDLLIRTSGESRLSNFLLWQVSYSEIWITKVLWPNFSKKDLLKAILEYQKRELRIGK